MSISLDSEGVAPARPAPPLSRHALRAEPHAAAARALLERAEHHHRAARRRRAGAAAAPALPGRSRQHGDRVDLHRGRAVGSARRLARAARQDGHAHRQAARPAGRQAAGLDRADRAAGGRTHSALGHLDGRGDRRPRARRDGPAQHRVGRRPGAGRLGRRQGQDADPERRDRRAALPLPDARPRREPRRARLPGCRHRADAGVRLPLLRRLLPRPRPREQGGTQ